MNEGDIRVRGLEAIRELVSKDDRYISMIGECDIIRDAVDILRRRTIGEGEEKEEKEEGEEGVSVREKNGILGIVLEMVEGGGWKGSYEELEEVVGRLEEEGEKEWRERKKDRRRRNGGLEWKEMERLAREVGWAIEKRKKMDGGGDGIATLGRQKKELEEEKRLRSESEKGIEEEKRNREAVEQEKRELEERMNSMRVELDGLKEREEEERYRPITSLDAVRVTIFPDDYAFIKTEGNTITHHGSNAYKNCFIRGEMTSV